MSDQAARNRRIDNPPFRTWIRKDASNARNALYAAIRGEERDLERIAAILDGVVEDLCPHGEMTLRVAVDEQGRQYVVCDECEVEWYPSASTIFGNPHPDPFLPPAL